MGSREGRVGMDNGMSFASSHNGDSYRPMWGIEIQAPDNLVDAHHSYMCDLTGWSYT